MSEMSRKLFAKHNPKCAAINAMVPCDCGAENSENWKQVVCPRCGAERDFQIAVPAISRAKDIQWKCKCGHQFNMAVTP